MSSLRTRGASGLVLLSLLCAAVHSFAAVTTMNVGRIEHTATLLNTGNVLVVSDTGSQAASAEQFDPGRNAWLRLPGLREHRSQHAANLLPNGRVLFSGGIRFGGVNLNSAELFDPARGTWLAASGMAHGRASHTATSLPGGNVLVAGGATDLSTLTSSCEIYDYASDRWIDVAPMSVSRIQHAAVRLADGRVLVIGGKRTVYGGVPDYLASAELFDPSTRTWLAAGSMASARTHHTATVLVDGRVLVVGGNVEFASLASAEIYSPATNTWTSAGSLAVAREAHTATLLPDGRVMVGGGGQPPVRHATIEIFDPATGAWTSGQPLVEGRTLHTATLLPDARVLFAGGTSDGFTKTAETVEPSPRLWTSASGSGPEVGSHAMTLLASGRVLVTGGRDTAGIAAASHVYDPSSATWTQAAPLPAPRSGHSQVLLPDGRALVVGGDDRRDAYLYNEASNAWTPAGTLTYSRSGQVAVLLASGHVLVVGGHYASYPELYDPAANQWYSTAGYPPSFTDGGTATLLRDGRVLVAGGASSGHPTIDASIYDPNTFSWKPVASMTWARYGHRAALLRDGRVLVSGGFSATGHALTVTEIYDPQADTWVRVGDSSPNVFFRLVMLSSGDVLSIGPNLVQRFDPSLNGWSTVGALAAFRAMPTAEVMLDGSVLVVGGGTYNGDAGPTSERLRHPLLDNVRRPALTAAPASLVVPGALAVDGIGFTGTPDANGGPSTASVSNIPVAVLQRIDNGDITTLSAGDTPWTPQRFTSGVLRDLAQGLYRVSVVVDGLESPAKLVTVANSSPAPASRVEFASASYSVNELDASVTVSIMRTGDCSRAAGVQLATANGTAKAWTDFVSHVATPISWAAGDCFPRNIVVFPIDNDHPDAARRFELRLAYPSNVTIGARSVATVDIRDDESAPIAMPGNGTIVDNAYGPLTVTGATLNGTSLSALTKKTVIQLGATPGLGKPALRIDFKGMSVGPGNVLVILSGAPDQEVVLNNIGNGRTFIDGLVIAEGSSGAPPPLLHLHDARGISVLGAGRVTSPGGLVVDGLGLTWTSGQPVYNEGKIDGGGALRVMGAAINGGGLFQGDKILLSTFGHANNPVNGAHFLNNGLNLAPSAGAKVELALNDYGSVPQTFNVTVHGDGVVAMPRYFAHPYGGLPANNVPLIPPTLDAPFGGGQMIVQATGALGLDELYREFAFPGGIVLKAGRRLDVADTSINNGWTGTGRTFQGIFFEAPSIVSVNHGFAGGINIVTNNLNWVNFSTLPAVAVNVNWILGAGASWYYLPADDVAPHLNPYGSMIETAAAGGCWTCAVNTAPVTLK